MDDFERELIIGVESEKCHLKPGFCHISVERGGGFFFEEVCQHLSEEHLVCWPMCNSTGMTSHSHPQETNKCFAFASESCHLAVGFSSHEFKVNHHVSDDFITRCSDVESETLARC